MLYALQEKLSLGKTSANMESHLHATFVIGHIESVSAPAPLVWAQGQEW